MKRPTILGQPCWRKGDVAEAIKVVARTGLDDKSTQYFLATHAPVDRIWDDLARRTITERDLFEHLLDPVNANVLALVQGEPGSGKSHLIRWLHLRLDLARRTGEMQDVVPVLVQRRTGSLKDALEQILQQLPQKFGHHLAQLREAIGNISDQTAREMLASQLQLELGPRWEERGNAPLPGSLRSLNSICLSAGFRKWLCRDEGVIHANIKRLTETSDAFERQVLPEFDATEFMLPMGLREDNSEDTRDLIDEFDEFPEARHDASNYFNKALRFAVKEMSGLGGTRLREIFDAIRADLKKQAQSLAVFIEDISVMSSLDEDIFTAVEPQDREDLCRLIAVLGVVTQGAGREQRFRENQLSRVTHKVSVGGNVTEAWLRDPNAVARFSARYLNAARLDLSTVTRIATQRQEGGEVGLSACTECLVREQCHATFGAASFDGVDVGFFPFNRLTPHSLLIHLDERIEGVRRNQRGLLERVLRPVLGDSDSLDAGEFPRVRLPVLLTQPGYWTVFEEQYLGGWPLEDRERVKFLCQAWVAVGSADEAAKALEPFRTTFRLPKFSAAPAGYRVGQASSAMESQSTNTATASPEALTSIPVELQAILDNLAAWEAGERLSDDGELRELLRQFIREGIPWSDHRLPPSIGPKLFSERTAVTLVGQRSKVQEGRFSVRFPSTDDGESGALSRRDVSRVLQALARFRHEGQRSWNFPHGEVHKRIASSWLRNHEHYIVEACQPPHDIDQEQTLKFAIQFLIVGALARRRAPLPATPADAISELFIQPTIDSSLTDEEESLAQELAQEFLSVREFVLSELSVPQGTGSINFINPIPIIDELRKGADAIHVSALPREYFSGFWKSRYQALNSLQQFARIQSIIDGQRNTIEQKLIEVRAAFIDVGLSVDDLPNSMKEYCLGLKDLTAIQDEALPLPDTDFEQIKPLLLAQSAVWASAIRLAQENSGPLVKGITFDPSPFREALASVKIGQKYLYRLERELVRHEAGVVIEGDPASLLAEIATSLDLIATREPSIALGTTDGDSA